MTTNEELIEQKILDIPEERTLVYPERYGMFELYMIAVRRARRIKQLPHAEFTLAREASRMTAYRFLEEIKKVCPEYYKHFIEMAADEMPD
jgi:hypothetical protein